MGVRYRMRMRSTKRRMYRLMMCTMRTVGLEDEKIYDDEEE